MQQNTITHYLPSGIKTVVRHVFGKGASFIMIWRELTIQQWDIKDTTGKNPLVNFSHMSPKLVRTYLVASTNMRY